MATLQKPTGPQQKAINSHTSLEVAQRFSAGWPGCTGRGVVASLAKPPRCRKALVKGGSKWDRAAISKENGGTLYYLQGRRDRGLARILSLVGMGNYGGVCQRGL